MTRFKDFGSGNNAPVEAISFMLYGEEFNCRPAIQGKILLDLVSKSGDEASPAVAAGVINTFFSTVLNEESYARFDTLATDPERIIDVDQLGEIVGWLVEQYASRPTQRPEDLPTGP